MKEDEWNISAYEGEEPFAFISYSHRDEAAVKQFLSVLSGSFQMIIDWSTEESLRFFANSVRDWNIRKTEVQTRQDLEEETLAGTTMAPKFASDASNRTEAVFAYSGSRPAFFANDDVSRLLSEW